MLIISRKIRYYGGKSTDSANGHRARRNDSWGREQDDLNDYKVKEYEVKLDKPEEAPYSKDESG